MPWRGHCVAKQAHPASIRAPHAAHGAAAAATVAEMPPTGVLGTKAAWLDRCGRSPPAFMALSS
eukprot:9083642-Alexandrium_andersonii.AAC.1